jgi:hypothetical protein
MNLTTIILNYLIKISFELYLILHCMSGKQEFALSVRAAQMAEVSQNSNSCSLLAVTRFLKLSNGRRNR